MSEVRRALYEGRPDDVEALLAADPPPDLDVFEAAAVGRTDRVAELLATSPDLALAWTDDGFTALQLACFFGAPDAARVLVATGADVDIPSRQPMGVRAINAAAAGPTPVECCRLLLAAGADVNGRQASGHTALDEARIRGHADLIALLLEHGATDGPPPVEVTG